MEAVYNQQLQTLLRPQSHDAYLFQCGVLYALERAATLVDDLLIARDAHDRAKRPAVPNDGRAFLNSEWYTAYRATQKP